MDWLDNGSKAGQVRLTPEHSLSFYDLTIKNVYTMSWKLKCYNDTPNFFDRRNLEGFMHVNTFGWLSIYLTHLTQVSLKGVWDCILGDIIWLLSLTHLNKKIIIWVSLERIWVFKKQVEVEACYSKRHFTNE